MKKKLLDKFKELSSSVLPLMLLVIGLNFIMLIFSGSGMPWGMFFQFLIGGVLLMIGMTFFSIGADVSMIPMGDHVGAYLAKTRKYVLLIVCCFLIGTLVTIAEPDLAVLATQFPGVPDRNIILIVAVGVGIFLAIGVLRIIRNLSLPLTLTVFYAIVLIVALFAPPKFLAVAFDSGGVTTGPITVPFIMAIGMGLAAVRSSKTSKDDSFGTVAVCSIGPIIAMLLLGLFTDMDGVSIEVAEAYNAEGSAVILDFFRALPTYIKDVAIALLPIIVFFTVFQLLFLHLRAKSLARIGVGLIYTFIGLTIFLTGVNVGFLPAGSFLGSAIAALPGARHLVLIPIGMIMGYYVVKAEPAVKVLNTQVEELTVGIVTKKAMMTMLSAGVAVSIGIAMLRVVTGVQLWYFLLGGYAISLGLSFIVPKMFTAIAFDSGGVASGAMTATFLLPFAKGACMELTHSAESIVTDAFGLVALVAMTPLITIQLLGLSYLFKTRKLNSGRIEIDDSVTVIEFDLEELLDVQN